MTRVSEDSPAAPPPAAAPGAEHRRQLGARGEEATARWYRQAGYEVVARNWRCPAGEIDLVALTPDGAVVVVCEVKTRSSAAFGRPEEAVTPAKQRRLRQLATRWLAQARASGSGRPSFRSVRFDVASVTAAGGDLAVDVIEDAF